MCWRHNLWASWSPVRPLIWEKLHNILFCSKTYDEDLCQTFQKFKKGIQKNLTTPSISKMYSMSLQEVNASLQKCKYMQWLKSNISNISDDFSLILNEIHKIQWKYWISSPKSAEFPNFTIRLRQYRNVKKFYLKSNYKLKIEFFASLSINHSSPIPLLYFSQSYWKRVAGTAENEACNW